MRIVYHEHWLLQLQFLNLSSVDLASGLEFFSVYPSPPRTLVNSPFSSTRPWQVPKYFVVEKLPQYEQGSRIPKANKIIL